MSQKCSIAIIGAGTIGSYYGVRLAESGHNVHFLIRRDYQTVREGGLRVISPDGDFTLTDPTITPSSEEIGPVDWVLCALKATSIEEAQELVRPCVSTDTRILVTCPPKRSPFNYANNMFILACKQEGTLWERLRNSTRNRLKVTITTIFTILHLRLY